MILFFLNDKRVKKQMRMGETVKKVLLYCLSAFYATTHSALPKNQERRTSRLKEKKVKEGNLVTSSREKTNWRPHRSLRVRDRKL